MRNVAHDDRAVGIVEVAAGRPQVIEGAVVVHRPIRVLRRAVIAHRDEPAVTPAMKYRCAKMNKITLGSMASTTPASTTEMDPVPMFPAKRPGRAGG